jgi:hypothetical protein
MYSLCQHSVYNLSTQVCMLGPTPAHRYTKCHTCQHTGRPTLTGRPCTALHAAPLQSTAQHSTAHHALTGWSCAAGRLPTAPWVKLHPHHPAAVALTKSNHLQQATARHSTTQYRTSRHVTAQHGAANYPNACTAQAPYSVCVVPAVSKLNPAVRCQSRNLHLRAHAQALKAVHTLSHRPAKDSCGTQHTA